MTDIQFAMAIYSAIGITIGASMAIRAGRVEYRMGKGNFTDNIPLMAFCWGAFWPVIMMMYLGCTFWMFLISYKND